MFDLSGKTALVTGASGGIGRDIARSLHGAGARIGLAGTRETVLQELANELGEGAEVLVADLSSSDGAAALAGAAETALDGLDILVNNAGITRDNLALRMKDEDWDAVLSVNLTAGFQLIRAALRGMMKPPARAYYRHYIYRRHHRKSGTGKLRGIESRYDRHEQITGARSCQPRHYG